MYLLHMILHKNMLVFILFKLKGNKHLSIKSILTLMQKNKSFFDLDTGLAEIELPAEYRSHFIRWSKKIEK